MNPGDGPSGLRVYCTLTEPGPGTRKFFSILCVCMAKNYVLAAWTEKGKVRMIPSLVNELSIPYREEIERLEGNRENYRREVGWLLARSRAHEAFARFLLRVGYPKEAYLEFENAAKVCAYGAGFPTPPLLSRFLSMHGECMDLTAGNRLLQLRYAGSELESLYEGL